MWVQVPSSPADRTARLFKSASNGSSIFSYALSPDCNHFAYIKSDGGANDTVYKDGKDVTGGYTNADSVAFSPDSKHFAFSGESDNAYYIISDGTPTLAAGRATSIAYSYDGKSITYAYDHGLYFNNTALYYPDSTNVGEQYTNASNLVISPDGNHLAFVASLSSDNANSGDEVVMKDNTLIGKDSSIAGGASNLVFSPDGTKLDTFLNVTFTTLIIVILMITLIIFLSMEKMVISGIL